MLTELTEQRQTHIVSERSCYGASGACIWDHQSGFRQLRTIPALGPGKLHATRRYCGEFYRARTPDTKETRWRSFAMLGVMACEHRLWLSDSIAIQLSSVADHRIRDGTECFLYMSSFLQWSVIQASSHLLGR